ncbi:hypothetical protein KY290_021360 [Solanum tuberosum]|uniref:Uncharacterized protein n=1 Tax=Solanum tuberosum TaxID=4113 RepID=A0ABQ7V3D1_SOLTU|nr:hypothetical protein KY289_020525 [Solanum tuberosum]KAH0757867.1 hypothetical protein KY290_021360 [Solanum tuberosum]
MIANIKNSSIEDSLDYDLKDSSDEDLEGYSPIHATAYSNFDCNAQYFSNMHPVSQNEAFENLSEISKDGEDGGRHFNTETNQISFTNELASQLETNLVEMENENETPYNLVDIPMYDGTGLSQTHLKAYLDWLASIGQDNEFNMILFVRTLTRPALMWDKGKTIVIEAPNVPPLVPEVRKAQTFIPLSEPISFIFKKLRSLGILQPRPNETPLHPFNPAKQCAFHSGMLGHTTDECQYLKEEIQNLLDSGMIIQ